MSAALKKIDAKHLEEVRAHYENYPYPVREPATERDYLYMPITEAFDGMNHFCFEGRLNIRKGFRALVAGGGTGDAIIGLAEQCRDYPACELVYVDMSQASMRIAKERAKVRGLANIRWVHDSLLNIPNLGVGKFDYINCSGVLHHLASPTEGLAALRSVLKDEGAMGIMLYAQYGRMAVYMMQEALRMLNRDEPNLQTQVDHAKAVLNNLPPTNWFLNSSPMVINEVRSGDIAIYDLLLHSQDRAYSIPQLYEFMEGAGLHILQMFSDDFALGNDQYNPVLYIKDPVLLEKVRSWPVREQQTLAELLHGKIEKHTFYAAPNPRKPADYRNLNMIPCMGQMGEKVAGLLTDIIDNADGLVDVTSVSSKARVMFLKTPHASRILKLVDNTRSLHEIFSMVIANVGKNAPDIQTLAMEFENFFLALNKYNWMFMRAKNSEPALGLSFMQNRVPL